MHIKHVSNVTFYHLSNRFLLNVMKVNVKINTMQNTNILLFVRSLSLTEGSFYIMKLCNRLFVLYCRNCVKDDKLRYLIPILRKLGAA